MRVFLIGFMCSGKSHVGRELARVMHMRNLDIDRLIEQRIGRITPWFQAHGEAAFRALESSVLAEVVQQGDVIVSTGGGTPCEGDNMARMLRTGQVVFLDVPFDMLLERIERKGGDRPLLFALKGEPLRARVCDLMAQRVPVYKQATMRVLADTTPETIAARIHQALRQAPVQDK